VGKRGKVAEEEVLRRKKKNIHVNSLQARRIKGTLPEGNCFKDLKGGAWRYIRERTDAQGLTGYQDGGGEVMERTKKRGGLNSLDEY